MWKLIIFLILITKSKQSNLPVKFSVQPESQIVQKGSKIELKCDYEIEDVSLENNLKLNWLFNSVELLETSKSNFYINKNRLIINSFDPLLNTGQYRCLLNSSSNINLVLLSQPANLSLARIDNFESSTEPNVIALSEGNVAIIQCKLPYSNPTAIAQFYFNDQLIPIQSDSNSRFRLFASGNLQISNIKQSDSGTYKCTARNLITNEIKQNSKKTILKVFEPFGTKLPEIVYSPIDTNRVQLGSNLTLECVANGAPVPLVSWEKFGGILPDKRSIQIFGNLILTNVQPEDKGTYVCRAENGPGQATFKTAMVDVFESPSIIKNSEFKYAARKGDSVELKCPIKSRPRADFDWYFEGRLVQNSANFRQIVNNDRSILTIKNFNPSLHSGIYQCFAQNDYGYTQADLILNGVNTERLLAGEELPKRPVIIMGPQNTTIYEGQSVVLLCVTSETSSGNTQINWLQNDLIIEPTLMRRFEINQLLGNLRIVSVQKSDAGIYKCIASNEYGMSTAEAYVNVKTTNKKIEDNVLTSTKKSANNNQAQTPSVSRPTIQQIGSDKILLKWNLLDSNSNLIDSTTNLAINNLNIAYFKVEYKTNKQQIAGIQANTWLTIDEQIDAKKREYILTDLNANEIYRFRITSFFQNGELMHSHQSAKFKLESQWSDSASASTSSTTIQSIAEFKLSQVQVQITQLWAISSSSLGLKWDILYSKNKTDLILNKKINGFYIYYRKLKDNQDQQQQLALYNYTRINVPVSIIDSSEQQLHQMIDTYIIANLEQSSQYEIKMTCYNLNGDLCSFSNSINGLTLNLHTTRMNKIEPLHNPSQQNVVILKSKQNEILFMILGVFLGVLSLLLIIFVVMCLIRQRQHKKLLAQLHNNSHKLASSSCPTLIYEDSLRQNNNRLNTNINSNYTGNLFIPATTNSNDSNSTNSQSMSTTTSSMTTPSNADSNNVQPSHILLLNGNTVSTASIAYANQPPPIPQVPPPSILPNPTATLNRININMNPLNGYLETMSNQQNSENFYHTLSKAHDTLNEIHYSDYNNTTLNMRQLFLKQQQQQQQILMNTLKTINLKQECVRSPSIRRNTSVNSSKKSKKNLKLEEQPQLVQQPANYYLLPNCLQNRNVYNEVDMMAIEAAILNQNLAGNVYLINTNHPITSFIAQPQQLVSPIANNQSKESQNAIYEPSEVDNLNSEQEPMLKTSHYAASSVVNENKCENKSECEQQEQQKLL